MSRLRVVRPVPVVVAATLLSAWLVGCGLGDKLTGERPQNEPSLVTVIVADISGSTLARRDAYVADAMVATTTTAELGGAVYLTTVDGLSADDVWQIPGRRFATSIGGGNQALARAARRQQAERLRPRVTRLLHAHGQAGSDLLAILTNVRRLFCTVPGVERRVVLISDGAVNAGGVDLSRHPPLTRGARRRLIKRLRHRQEIPAELDCQTGSAVRVWLSGLGAGIGNRAAAMATRRFFIDAVESTGVVIAAEGPQLLASSFGAGQANSGPVAEATADRQSP